MGKGIALVLCCLWTPIAAAADGLGLRGQWSIEVPAVPGYHGVVMIDADQRATWDAPADSGRPANLRGYVARNEGPKAEIVLTNGAAVGRLHCVAQSGDLLHCYFAFTHTDRISSGIVLRRVGPGPQKLTPFLP